VVTRIEQDGTIQRRVVDTAQCDDCLQWGRLAARALEFPPPYRPVPGIPVYHVSVGEQVILVAEHDLGGPLLNLVTAVLALGEAVLARSRTAADHQPDHNRFRHEPILADSMRAQTQVSDGIRQFERVLQARDQIDGSSVASGLNLV
jgi:hypothetical protein